MIMLVGHFMSWFWWALPYRMVWLALVLPWLTDLITLNFSLWRKLPQSKLLGSFFACFCEATIFSANYFCCFQGVMPYETQNVTMLKWLYIYCFVYGGALSLSLVSPTFMRPNFLQKNNVKFQYTCGDCILTMNFPMESCFPAHDNRVYNIHFIVCLFMMQFYLY